MGIAIMNINKNCRFIVVGWKNGLIVIYDLMQNPPVVQAISNDCFNKNLIQFEWSMDGSSFVALTQDGLLYYFIMTGNTK